MAWIGLIEGPSGYADEARGFLRALERGGCAPAARDLLGAGPDAKLGGGDREMVRRALSRPVEGAAVAVHHYAPSWARGANRVPGAVNVARTMFETDRIPRAWLEQLLSRDEVWVPCRHNAEAFERGGIPSSRLRVIGGTLDFDVFAAGCEPLELDLPPGHRVFLSNFEFSARKAWRELLVAWARAFSPTDPVCLVLKTTSDPGGRLAARLDAELEAAARTARRPALAPVRLLAETLAPSALARLYARADAYVLASRGEGWGRPYMEALAMGLPTIASRWSGPTEFMEADTSWFVDGELVAVPEDHGVFADDVAGHRWFEPDLDSLTAALTAVADDFEAARRRAAPARARLIERFGLEATLSRLAQSVAEVSERAAGPGRGPGACTLRGPFGRTASLAIVNDSLLRELERAGVQVRPRPPGSPPETSQRPSLSHSWPPDFTAGGEGPSAIILPWEYGHPPAEWVARIRGDVDRVYVPSQYVREGYLAAGVPPGIVEVLPNGVDPEMFRPDGPPWKLGARAGTTFLFVGGTLWRKGIDLLLAAWEQAFTAEDDVLLVVKDFGVGEHYRGQTGGEAVQTLSRRPDVAPVVYLDEDLPPERLPDLYRAADALVAPYRGEGFCLPALEAMACGVPVIHPEVGPTQEFVGEGGWSVAAHRSALTGQVAGIRLAGTGYVHEVDVAELAGCLHAVASAPEERLRRGRAARRAALGFAWSEVASRLAASLDELTAEGLRPARRVRPARPESRARTVVYAPDWDEQEVWLEALVRWGTVVSAAADATLVMPVREDRAALVLEAILGGLRQAGLSLEGLPDLALHQQADEDPAPLVAVADAVLLDRRQARELPPALMRRAPRVISAVATELEHFAAGLPQLDGRLAEAA